ncbi:MAG: HNH endonuclease signature motif containing protein [Cellulosilyticaceae bacterium]
MSKETPKVNGAIPLAEIQIERVVSAGISMSAKQQRDYIAAPDDLGEFKAGMLIPDGYKKCGRCQHVLKFYLFNKNSGSKTNTTGNCKVCQKESASKSYGKTKQKRNYRKYYAENKEMKQEQARKYYADNKESINKKHQSYLKTKKGQKVMQKAHAKRANAIATHKGIPWKREWVLDRDARGGEFAICYLCGQPILDTSGSECHMDHVVSIGNGGLDCFTNVAAVHQTCNLTKEKDDRNLQADQVEAIVKLAEDYIDEHPELFDTADEEAK